MLVDYASYGMSQASSMKASTVSLTRHVLTQKVRKNYIEWREPGSLYLTKDRQIC